MTIDFPAFQYLLTTLDEYIGGAKEPHYDILGFADLPYSYALLIEKVKRVAPEHIPFYSRAYTSLYRRATDPASDPRYALRVNGSELDQLMIFARSELLWGEFYTSSHHSRPIARVPTRIDGTSEPLQGERSSKVFRAFQQSALQRMKLLSLSCSDDETIGLSETLSAFIAYRETYLSYRRVAKELSIPTPVINTRREWMEFTLSPRENLQLNFSFDSQQIGNIRACLFKMFVTDYTPPESTWTLCCIDKRAIFSEKERQRYWLHTGAYLLRGDGVSRPFLPARLSLISDAFADYLVQLQHFFGGGLILHQPILEGASPLGRPLVDALMRRNFVGMAPTAPPTTSECADLMCLHQMDRLARHRQALSDVVRLIDFRPPVQPAAALRGNRAFLSRITYSKLLSANSKALT